MVFASERPHSFGEALALAKRILSANLDLVSRGTVDAEASEIVRAAVRAATGRQLSRIELFSRAKDRFPDEAGDNVIIYSHARAEGRLLQHVIGRQVFLDHDYEVNASVLVPRPETEVLARVAIEALRKSAPPELGLEIGLGSGILSGELLSSFPNLRMVASETSDDAIAVARANIGKILGDGQKRLTCVAVRDASEVIAPLARELGGRKADFLISNPPYLAPGDSIDDEVRKHEPAAALFPQGGDPMHFYAEIAAKASGLLKPRGLVLVELAAERAAVIEKTFRNGGWSVEIFRDLNEFPRVLRAEREA